MLSFVPDVGSSITPGNSKSKIIAADIANLKIANARAVVFKMGDDQSSKDAILFILLSESSAPADKRAASPTPSRLPGAHRLKRRSGRFAALSKIKHTRISRREFREYGLKIGQTRLPASDVYTLNFAYAPRFICARAQK